LKVYSSAQVRPLHCLKSLAEVLSRYISANRAISSYLVLPENAIGRCHVSWVVYTIRRSTVSSPQTRTEVLSSYISATRAVSSYSVLGLASRPKLQLVIDSEGWPFSDHAEQRVLWVRHQRHPEEHQQSEEGPEEGGMERCP
jgi:hypothetical protein